nr:oligosaccharide flippase family protein [Neobacillus sp. Marseille-Q6967]
MKTNIKKFIHKPFVRNVFLLATGTAAAQAVTMALSPFITRLYGPEVFGLSGVFTAVVEIIVPIAALTYPIAIVLPKSDKAAKGLIRLSLYISIIIALLIAILVILFNQTIVKIFNIEEIAPFLYLLPLVILFAGLLQVTEQWLIRKKQFKITAKVTFFQSLFLQGSKFGFGFFYPVASVLIFLTVFGQFMKALQLIILAKKTNYKHNEVENINPEPYSIRGLAKKHIDFPLFRAPQSFINAVSSSLPILMLTSFFGPASAGFYSIGITVLSIPSQLIGKSVGDVFYPRIADAANNGENLSYLIKKATLALGAVGIIPYGMVGVFGPWLFGFVFGPEWIQAGEYARWISLGVYFMFIYQPSVRALPVLSAQPFHLKFTIITLITRLAVLSVGYYVFSSDIVAIALYSISGALLNLLLIQQTLIRCKTFNTIPN